jgi:hypothetical protein
LVDDEKLSRVLFNWNTSVKIKDEPNIEIVKAKDGVRFKDMIPYPGIWGNLASTTLFCITSSMMFMMFCMCFLRFIRSS